MAISKTVVKTGASRVFTIKHRAGPTREPVYLGASMMGSVSWGQGDVTKIEIPSDIQYNQWDQIDSFQPSPDRATSTISVYLYEDRSIVLDFVRLRCAFDAQVHIGFCEDPRDFDGGWRKVLVFEEAKITSYDTPELGALQGDGQAVIMEDIAISSRSVYEVLRMLYRLVATEEVGEEVIAIDVCDTIACGDCDDVDPSDGCQKVFAVTNSATSSPGVLPQVIITTDQYGVNAIIERWVTSFAIGENASDAACVGQYFVVLNVNESWTAVATGFVAAGSPQAIWNYAPTLSFIAGAAGYIYKMGDPANGVTVLDAGVAVTDDLNDIEGFDTENVTAVGDAGAVVNSIDGTNFSALTAPVGPTDLYAVAYRTKNEIWVGGDNGSVYVTTDYGTNWTTKSLPGSLTQVDKITWVNETVGFIAGRVSGPNARILRTINGGYTWYVVPESPGNSIPVVDYINDFAVCANEPNILFAGGLADNGADGVIIYGKD
jgi:photosystem II stability/assembly factor-like uncharacterized protein